MKYTRYNNKKKNNSLLNILFMGLIFIFAAFLIGTMVSRILFKDKMPKDEGNNGTNIVADEKENTGDAKKEITNVRDGILYGCSHWCRSCRR